MQFWGVEVKAKEPSSVALEDGHIIHLSQAALGEVKKDNEHVTLYVKVEDKKFVLGILSQNNPQLSFDLVFDKDFEISHSAKNGSVHLLGYQSELPDGEFSDFSDDEEEMPVPVPIRENGIPAAAKAAAKASKDNKPKPEEKVEDEDDDSDDDDSEDDDDSDDDMLEGSDDDDVEEGSDDDDDDDSSDEETPAKADVGKKRSKPDAKTPEPKKAKLTTPQKTDGKKGGAGGAHTATPHPSKKGGKTPGADKSPKSNVSCGSCKKTFNSDTALQSHNKAKHSSGK